MENTTYTWLQIPKGNSNNAASLANSVLPSQFIPAPFESRTSGYVLTRSPKDRGLTLCENAGSVSKVQEGSSIVGIANDQLYFSLNGKKTFLNDSYKNTEDAIFSLSAPACFCTFDGSEAIVARAVLSLKGTAGIVSNAVAYDFVCYKNLPLVQILIHLNPDNDDGLFPIHIAKLVLEKASVKKMGCGFPKINLPTDKNGLFMAENFITVSADDTYFAMIGGFPTAEITDTEITLEADTQIGVKIYDILEYENGLPFAASILCGEESADAENWLTKIPCLLPPTTYSKDMIDITSGDLSVTFGNNGSGIDLMRMYDKKSDTSLLSHGNHLLFTVHLRHLKTKTQRHLSSSAGWNHVQTANTENLYTFIFSDHQEVPNLSVILTAFCDADKNRISWDISVQNQNSEYTVLEAEYPRMTVDTTEDTTLLSPYGCGEIRKHLENAAIHAALNYPSFGASMQFSAVYREDIKRGLYYGIHDGAPSYKICNIDKHALEHTVRLGYTYPFEFIDRCANSSALAGKAIWQLFSGDWYDASLIYRDFVEKEASWLPPIDENGPIHTPEWMKTCSHWWLSFLDDMRAEKADTENWVQDTLDAQKDLGVASADHVYHWHQIPFDNEYPHYFPAKKDFLMHFKRLQDSGIKIMPYINSRVWDTLDGGEEDWEYTSAAMPNTAKDLDGNTFNEASPFFKKNGQRVQFGVMCPSTVLWQDLQCDLIRKLYQEVGVDAVYLDQIAAAKVDLCADPTHNHPAGGGRWWIENYVHMINRMKAVSPKTGGFVTECTGDAYMKNIEGLLSWAWVRNSQVPAFSAVYGGRVVMVGRDYNSLMDEEGVKIFAAQSFLYGEQMGWIRPTQYLKTCYREFYKKCVRTREAYKEFFYAGKMLRPLAITSDQETIATYGCVMAEGQIVTSPAVIGGHWKRTSDGKELITIINMSNNDAKTEISLPESIRSIRFEGDLVETISVSDGKISLTLPAQAVITAVV